VDVNPMMRQWQLLVMSPIWYSINMHAFDGLLRRIGGHLVLVLCISIASPIFNDHNITNIPPFSIVFRLVFDIGAAKSVLLISNITIKANMSRLSLLAVLSFVWTTTSPPHFANALQLTVDNFEAMTEGKNVFIKMFAPWCGHCRAMADDWKKLEDDWKDHEVALIAEVDCTSDGGQPICEEYYQVDGFPTLLFGDPLAPETYDGPRDYEAMSAHAKEHISKPICSVFRIEACSDEDKTLIESLQAKSDDDLEQMVRKVTDLVQLEEADFDEKVKKIQEQYDALVTDYNSKLEDIKARYNYKFVEQIMTARLAESMEGMEEEKDL
jgi:thiol-disulfide isomerase/thioredoxin